MPEERSIAQLLTDLSSQLSTLVRQEILLARMEVMDLAQRVRRAAVLMGIGVICAVCAALTGVGALVLVLIELGVVAWLAAVLVALTFGLAGAIAMRAGSRHLHVATVGPRHTMESLKETTQWFKNETAGHRAQPRGASR